MKHKISHCVGAMGMAASAITSSLVPLKDIASDNIITSDVKERKSHVIVKDTTNCDKIYKHKHPHHKISISLSNNFFQTLIT